MLSAASSNTIIMKTLKMPKIAYKQMPAPRELPQQIPAPPPDPPGKARMRKPKGGGKFLVQIPGGALGRGWWVVMEKIDSCITTTLYPFFISPHPFSPLFQEFLAITKSRTSQTKIHAPIPTQPFHILFTHNYSTYKYFNLKITSSEL